MDWARIRRTAERQRGLVTLPQLRAAGTDDIDIRRCVATGGLWRIRHGLFSIDEPDGSFETRVMAACLHHSVHPIVASGLTAAHLWDLWQEPDRLEASVRYPAQVRLGADVRVHRSRDLTAADVTRLRSIPVTTPERTLVDLGRLLPEREVLRVLEHAVVRERVDLGRLWQIRRRVGTQGRIGAGVIDRAIMALHPDAAGTESGPEAGLLRTLGTFGLPAPRIQWWVRVGERRFRLDFAYPQRLLAIEYDGAAWHTSRAQRCADRERDALLASAGWTTIRISAADLRPPVNGQPFERIRQLISGRSRVL